MDRRVDITPCRMASLCTIRRNSDTRIRTSSIQRLYHQHLNFNFTTPLPHHLVYHSHRPLKMRPLPPIPQQLENVQHPQPDPLAPKEGEPIVIKTKRISIPPLHPQRRSERHLLPSLYRHRPLSHLHHLVLVLLELVRSKVVRSPTSSTIQLRPDSSRFSPRSPKIHNPRQMCGIS